MFYINNTCLFIKILFRWLLEIGVTENMSKHIVEWIDSVYKLEF